MLLWSQDGGLAPAPVSLLYSPRSVHYVTYLVLVRHALLHRDTVIVISDDINPGCILDSMQIS